MSQKAKSSEKKTKQDKNDKKSSTRKDVIEIVAFIALAALLVFSFNWFLGLALNTSSPLVVVTTESMEPIYWGSNRPEYGIEKDIRKDMLILRGVDPAKIAVGDAIVFNKIKGEVGYDTIPVVHQVVDIYYNASSDEYWFATKGNNNETNSGFLDPTGYPAIAETHINEDRVVGKVIGRIPYLGGLINYFREPPGIYYLLGAIAIVFIASFLFSGSDDEEDEVFPDDVSKKEEDKKAESSFMDKLKKAYKTFDKHKHFIIPGLILGIIVLVPIIDTLSADWGSHYGVTDVNYRYAGLVTLQEGEKLFVDADVTLNNPGHWHQKLELFTMSVSNSTTGEVLGENTWRCVYSFEGSKTVNFGVWLDPLTTIDDYNYTLTVTAHLESKFGGVQYDTFELVFFLAYD